MLRIIQTTRRPDITFYSNGRIAISARVARALSISPGDAINIAIHCNEISCHRAQSGLQPGIAQCSPNCSKGEYLLYAIHNPFGRHEAQCYPTNKNSHNFCANSVRLCKAIFSVAKINTLKASFMTGDPVSINHTSYLPIITLRPLSCFPAAKEK